MVNITHDDLAKGAKKLRKELLMMPVHTLAPVLNHMSLRTGIRYAETVGQLEGDMEFGPYSDTRIDKSETKINGRTHYTSVLLLGSSNQTQLFSHSMVLR